ncbi:MAG: insulinase family protein [Planctomycetes bacterium]|nr:insulinase family protein [Planctomycetota bacterium]
MGVPFVPGRVILALLAFFSLLRFPPALAEFRPLAVPDFLRTDLSNGATLLAAAHREQPVVSFEFLVRTGSLHDPRGKEGLAAVVADMLLEGTDAHDSMALAAAMDQIGGEFHVEAGGENTRIEAQVLGRESERTLDLLVEMLRRPTFPPAALRRVLQQHRAGIRAGYSDPDFIGMRHFQAMVYGSDLPLGRFPTDRSVRGLRRHDLVDFYDRHFHAANLMIAMIGDTDPTAMLAALEARLGDWRTGTRTTPVRLPDSFVYPARRRLVAKKNLTQATLLFGGRGLAAASPDHEAFRMANHILGAGDFSSRLMNAVRSQEGKTYGIFSSNRATVHAGTFLVQTFTRNEQARETVTLVLQVLKEATEGGLREEELAKAKTALIGSFPLGFESPKHWAEAALGDLFLDRPLDYTPQARERIARTGLERVNRVLRETVHAEDLSLVVVGDPEALAGPLGSLGRFEIRKERDE